VSIIAKKVEEHRGKHLQGNAGRPMGNSNSKPCCNDCGNKSVKGNKPGNKHEMQGKNFSR
jgi:hypothetical protein